MVKRGEGNAQNAWERIQSGGMKVILRPLEENEVARRRPSFLAGPRVIHFGSGARSPTGGNRVALGESAASRAIGADPCAQVSLSPTRHCSPRLGSIDAGFPDRPIRTCGWKLP